jgi:hypothetical protein
MTVDRTVLDGAVRFALRRYAQGEYEDSAQWRLSAQMMLLFAQRPPLPRRLMQFVEEARELYIEATQRLRSSSPA